MRFVFDLKPNKCSGETRDGICYVHLDNIYTYDEVIGTIIHEELHQAINMVAKTTSKQDHWAMKKIWADI